MVDRLVALLAVLALSVAACTDPARDPGEQVAVGVGAAVEQRVLAALTLVALERAGIGVRAVEAGDVGGARRQAETGDVDLFWDYSGAALSLELLPRQPPPALPEESFERVARADEQRNGFVWLGPTQANATLALFVRSGEVPETDRTLTWLSRRLSEGAALCADPDFLTRQGGLPSLAEEYSIALGSLVEVPAAEAEAITRVASGECFAGLATATSGAAQGVGLVPVADDLGVFPAFIAAPVVRAPVLQAEPAIRDALAPLSGLTTEQLRQLNGRVEAGEDARAVAEEVLAAPPPPAP